MSIYDDEDTPTPSTSATEEKRSISRGVKDRLGAAKFSLPNFSLPKGGPPVHDPPLAHNELEVVRSDEDDSDESDVSEDDSDDEERKPGPSPSSNAVMDQLHGELKMESAGRGNVGPKAATGELDIDGEKQHGSTGKGGLRSLLGNLRTREKSSKRQARHRNQSSRTRPWIQRTRGKRDEEAQLRDYDSGVLQSLNLEQKDRVRQELTGEREHLKTKFKTENINFQEGISKENFLSREMSMADYKTVTSHLAKMNKILLEFKRIQMREAQFGLRGPETGLGADLRTAGFPGMRPSALQEQHKKGKGRRQMIEVNDNPLYMMCDTHVCPEGMESIKKAASTEQGGDPDTKCCESESIGGGGRKSKKRKSKKRKSKKRKSKKRKSKKRKSKRR